MSVTLPSEGREVRLVARPVGRPKSSDFAIAQVPIRDPGPGEILVRNTWMSVDPYMRGRMNDLPSYVPPFALDVAMDGGAVGVVVASNAPELSEGTTVLHKLGWRDYATLDANHAEAIDTEVGPAPAYLSVLGMPGLTAYVGLKVIAPVAPGEQVFVSGAAGAVGMVAARVAKELGASRVVGSAGGPEKAARLVNELGYDAALDYREGELRRQLAGSFPDGIDVFFDNVGGSLLEAGIANMRQGGRVALCGAISQYNATEAVPGPRNMFLVTTRRLNLRGYIVTDHHDLRAEYLELAGGWLRDGSLVVLETVVDGLDHAVEAFLGMFDGANTGKMLVRLDGADDVSTAGNPTD